jgi:uncharacterized protein (TIGR03067 family)
MKTTAAIALGLFACIGLTAAAEDKKGEAPKLEGKYELTGGKKDGKDISDESKKGKYTISSDKITIEGMGVKFVMGYKLDAKATPTKIDMEILEGPEGTKGSKAQGIVEKKDDVVRLAYSTEKDKRPKDFDGKDWFMFELKKMK